MTRAAFLRKIETLTDEEIERVAPYLEAGLDAIREGIPAEEVADLLRAVQLGRESARTEPLIDNDAVFVMARARSARP
jgi:hypothetical protein